MDYETTVRVAADPTSLWHVMVDVEAWPKWTASMQHVERLDEGDLRVGSRARVKQPRLFPATWRVTELQPGTSFTWESSSAGVTARGGHRIATDGTITTLTLTLQLSGPLAGAMGLLVGSRSRRYVNMEVDGLRRAAEDR